MYPRSSRVFFNDTATTEIYTLSLHDALPISRLHLKERTIMQSAAPELIAGLCPDHAEVEIYNEKEVDVPRSEEHTSELQSRQYLVCRLLLEKKKVHTRCCFA